MLVPRKKQWLLNKQSESTLGSVLQAGYTLETALESCALPRAPSLNECYKCNEEGLDIQGEPQEE